MKLTTMATLIACAGCLGAQTSTQSQTTTTTTVTTKESSDCPVTQQTKTFGLMTPDGRVVRFDAAGNSRVVEMMKSDRDFNSDISSHRPVKVRVVALPNGDVMVIKDIKADRQQ